MRKGVPFYCLSAEENHISFEQVVIHLTDGLDATYAEMKRKTDALQQSGEEMDPH